MDNKDAIAELTSLIGQKQNEIDSLKEAMTLLQSGYQTDQEAQVAAITAATDPLNVQIVDLQTQVSALTGKLSAAQTALS